MLLKGYWSDYVCLNTVLNEDEMLLIELFSGKLSLFKTKHESGD